jgi:hypothetical protein
MFIPSLAPANRTITNILSFIPSQVNKGNGEVLKKSAANPFKLKPSPNEAKVVFRKKSLLSIR